MFLANLLFLSILKIHDRFQRWLGDYLNLVPRLFPALAFYSKYFNNSVVPGLCEQTFIKLIT
jgi:hypothetical protein